MLLQFASDIGSFLSANQHRHGKGRRICGCLCLTEQAKERLELRDGPVVCLRHTIRRLTKMGMGVPSPGAEGERREMHLSTLV